MSRTAAVRDVTRVTLVLPNQVWEEVKRLAPTGQRSRLVAELLAEGIRQREQATQLERLQQFQEYLFQKYGAQPSSADDVNQMREEHDGEIAGLP